MSLSQLLPSGISTDRILSQISTKTSKQITRNDVGPELYRSFDQRFNTLVAKDLKEYQVLKRNASKMSSKVKKFIDRSAKAELNRIEQIAEQNLHQVSQIKRKQSIVLSNKRLPGLQHSIGRPFFIADLQLDAQVSQFGSE